MNALLLLVPISVALAYVQANAITVFATAAAAIIPLASWIRRATEQIANRAGSSIGGLLNVTFGNAAELILALFVLQSGNAAVVKATITGSIIGGRNAHRRLHPAGDGVSLRYPALKRHLHRYGPQRHRDTEKAKIGLCVSVSPWPVAVAGRRIRSALRRLDVRPNRHDRVGLAGWAVL